MRRTSHSCTRCGTAAVPSGSQRLAHRARQTRNIENQGHRTVTEDSCAGDAIDVAVIGLQRLDYDLLLPEQLIDTQPDPLAVALHHHDQTIAGFALAPAAGLEHLLQPHYRQVLTAERQH